ncbi:efflux RND transporter permease subunit [Alysiella filiformis]|uniref:Efflux pump membrane transporter n=1 Tax=Alysiella filiformis DSM 16848 TaxID=1120981 RepID=A0A286E2Z4_9NEIS|nr:efflux RND transporter permease subunit [Alysiella filiformis]QMT31155.1 efflux RND transporter permease subunit [Alysiella filiformis]UBQ55852.1 efflux RND transporter permease subunit [Alysiella filiformis DSM 16848]SOD65254.1 multidrug efflux pump [Alysiella filiformis DSM 16848]
MAKFFIERPVFAWVISIFIILAGVIAIRNLPVSQYPSVGAPTITLSATYPGASAQVMEDSVLAVIERAMNGIEGLDYMSTNADSNGAGSVSLTFKSGTNEDMAQMNVQNKLSEITATLPATVQQYGVTVSKSRSNFLMVIILKSEQKTLEDMADYAQRNVIPELQRLEGVGGVRMFAAQRAMRVWVDPVKLKSYDLSFADVSAAIQAQNAQISAGSLGSLPATEGQTITATITAQGQLSTPEEFGEVMLKTTTGGANVYLKDVARIELGTESYAASTRLNGTPAVGMAVMLSNSGNATATAKLVRAKMKSLQSYFPADMTWAAPYDTSKFVDISINKVIATLVEAMVLVFIVMFLFLQNFRYTLIPAIVVPISLLGGFAGIYYLGMSINVLTMFAMVLVIGIVVDDAIVVVENVERIMAEEGLPPMAATKKAMSQISGAVIGITAVLISVFIPLMFFSGAQGKIYTQFAATMALAIGFSAFLALTLTPALCATMLKPIKQGHHEKKGFFGWFNRKFDKTNHRYKGWVESILRRSGSLMITWIALTAGAGYVYTTLPTSFLPSEDSGNLFVIAQLPAGATKARTDETVEALEKTALSFPEVKDIITVSGFSFGGSAQNMAMGFVILKDWDERLAMSKEMDLIPRLIAGDFIHDANIVVQKLTGALLTGFANGQKLPENHLIKDGFTVAVNPPAIMELGTGGLEFYVQDRNNMGHDALLAKRNQLMGAMAQAGIFTGTRPDGLEDAPQLVLNIDRETAAAQGVSLASIRSTLATALGGSYVNDFPNNGRLQKVMVQAENTARMQDEDVLNLSVVNNKGVAIPLSTFVSKEWKVGMQQSIRFNGYPAMKLSTTPTGVSSGEAMARLQAIMSEIGEGNYSIEWAGQAREEAKGSSETTLVYALALLAVFLVLAALYESWAIPLSVLLVAPLGFLGVVLGVWARNFFNTRLGIPISYANDIYFVVGMITVVGLSAKNAILIIEFAKDLQEQGKTAFQAALDAAHLRFRPILMTSFAFILGVVPLYFSSGASAASQRAIGTTVFWGMTLGTLLSVFFVPVFYVFIRKIFKGKHETRTAREAASDAGLTH